MALIRTDKYPMDVYMSLIYTCVMFMMSSSHLYLALGSYYFLRSFLGGVTHGGIHAPKDEVPRLKVAEL